MREDVDRLVEIVAKYDQNLCTKANKQELLAVDNKFRQYVKKAKYKPFVETTELEYVDLKAEVKDVVQVVTKVKKHLPNDIQQAVRKATSHLKQEPKDQIGGKDIEMLLLQAHLEASVGNSNMLIHKAD